MKFINLGENRYLNIDGLRAIATVTGTNNTFHVTAHFDGVDSDVSVKYFDNATAAAIYAEKLVKRLSGGNNEIFVL